LKVVYKITRKSFINEKGEVVFIRKANNKEKMVRLEKIEDAISQNLHILENLFVEFFENYESIQADFGEISEMRNIFEEIQKELTKMVTSINPKKVDLSILVKGLKNSRNKHKKRIYQLLGGDLQSINDLTEAHSAVVKRIEELQGIIKGTIIQTKKLVKIKKDSERKISYAYQILSKSELDLKEIKKKNKDGEEVIKRVISDIAGLKANKVIYTLEAVTPVNPYKSRIESKDVQKLNRLVDLFTGWKNNKVEIEDIIQTISRARKKLKRIVRDKRNFKEINNY
jgi:hypothetical protein